VRANNDAAFTFTFSTEAGANYVLEYTDSLVPTQWLPIRTLLGTGGDVSVEHGITNVPARFFRIRVE
jgi:hypothetical protein